ncbi:MAG: PAS domain-containing protein [Candidatus Poribacteria bacterium]|nr:PAS domain-containing protein [Candidatus Poribacteria bacterium]
MQAEDGKQSQRNSEIRRLRQQVARLERDRDKFKRMSEADPYYNGPDMFASADAVSERVLHCNEALCAALGYAEAEIVGRPISVIYHPDSVEGAKKAFASLVSDGTIRDMELVLRKSDGSTLAVNLNAVTYRNTRGKALYCRFIWRDITRQKETERELRASEERFHQLANSVREVFWLMSLEGDEFFYLSPGYDEIWGRSRTDLMAAPMSWADSIYPDDLPQVIANFERQKRGDLVEYEFRMVRPDGEIRWIHARAFPVNDDNGVPYRVAGFALDITERKQTEELTAQQQRQLILADKMASLGVMTAGVAHEINNPNGFILQNGQVLEKYWLAVMPILDRYYQENGDFMCAGEPYTKLKTEIKDMTLAMISGARRIQEIVDALSDFSQSGDEELKQSVDCNEVINAAMVIIRNLIKSASNNFSLDLESGLPMIQGNAQQIEQVFINLITNACHALPDPSKKISVSTRKRSNDVLIEVCDEGEGIPPENLERIMDAFFTTKRDAGGNGLGLSISYTIVKNHGGKLTFSSKLGRGTTATVKLPAAV